MKAKPTKDSLKAEKPLTKVFGVTPKFFGSLKFQLPKKNSLKKEIKSKKIRDNSFFLVAAIILVLAVAFLFLSGNETVTKKKTKTVAPEKEGTLEEKKEEKALLPEKKYDLCLKKISVQERDECLQELAIEQNKPSLCDELTNLDSEKCKRLVWRASAVISQEIEKCNELLTEFDKQECIKQIALNSADKTICFELDSSRINSCLIELATQEKDLSVCDSIKGSAINTCKFNAIVSISDADLCDSLDLPSIKFDCISRIAEQNNDISLCERITDSIMKKRCEKNLSS
jgi:hypothetical protein